MVKTKKRYAIIIAIVIFFSLIPIFPLFRYPKATQQFNVLLITIDSLRPDHLSCYGYKRNTSPNMDKLAKEGVMFTQAISQGAKTIPSFPSIMTSLYPSQHSIVTEQQSYDSINHPVLAEILKEKGYRTEGIIAHNLSHVGLEKGFDSLEMLGCVTADLLTKKASSFLEKNKDKKFFLWLHYFDPHAPYRPSPPYDKKYLNDNVYKSNRHVPISTRRNDVHYSLGVIPIYVAENNITDVDYYISQYDGEINFADEQIGILLEKIKELGLDKKTIIVITADHGEHLGEHGIYFAHGTSLYDTLIRVPLIIKCDDMLPQGKIIDHQVAHIDIMPTILDLMGIKAKIKISGMSLLPLVLKDKRYPSRIIVSERFEDTQNPKIETKILCRSLRTDSWKLIYERVKYRLYNLKKDPAESVNLVRIERGKFRYFRQKLFAYSRILPSSVKRGRSLDEETEEKLKSLGYVSGGRQLQEKVSIAQGDMRLVFGPDDKTVRIYYADKEITAADTISTSFEIEGKIYSSLEAVWQVDKIDDQRVVVKCAWPELPLRQIWEFKILSDKKLSWKVEIDTEKEIKITKWNSSLMLSGREDEWVTVDESQKFGFAKHREGSVVLKDLSNRCIGVLSSKRDSFPAVMLISDSDPTKDLPVIRYSECFKNKVRMLCFYGAKKADAATLSSGKYNFFSGKVAFMNKEEMDNFIQEARNERKLKEEEVQMPFTIERGDLKLFFDYGQGRIYYRGRELTNRLGLYTSLSSENNWHDSQNALWEIKKVNDHKIIGRGTWIHLPISQNWEIDLVADNIIKWKIKMQVYEPVKIEQQQANIMLSPKYRDWLALGSGAKGAFPLRFHNREEGWIALYGGIVSQLGKVAVNLVHNKEAREFPSVVFDCMAMDKTYFTSIQNTDEIFKSRVLCCYKNNDDAENNYLQPGTYDYFNGKIEIDTLQSQ